MIFLFLFLSVLRASRLSDTFNVKDYGAVGDGKTLDTVAISKTCDAAKQAGGGTILFPAPGDYLTAPFNITSNDTTLLVEKGATILGVQDKSLYPIIPPLPSYGKSREGFPTRFQPLVFAANLKNIVIRGEGVIDGQGKYWWDLHHGHKLLRGRPRLVELMWCSNIEVTEITLKDSGFWTLHPIYCDNVHVHDMTILAPPGSPNTDGIDPDSTINMVVERCNINVSDDHIAVKSGMDEAGRKYNRPIRNLTVRDSVFYHGDGLSIGSETSGGIFDVLFQNITFKAVVNRGCYIKSGRARGGRIQNIRFEDIDIQQAYHTIFEINLAAYGVGVHDPVLKDVHFKNIKGTGGKHGLFKCLIDSHCHGITMEDIKTNATEKWECEYAYGEMTRVDPISCLKPEK